MGTSCQYDKLVKSNNTPPQSNAMVGKSADTTSMVGDEALIGSLIIFDSSLSFQSHLKPPSPLPHPPVVPPYHKNPSVNSNWSRTQLPVGCPHTTTSPPFTASPLHVRLTSSTLLHQILLLLLHSPHCPLCPPHHCGMQGLQSLSWSGWKSLKGGNGGLSHPTPSSIHSFFSGHCLFLAATDFIVLLLFGMFCCFYGSYVFNYVHCL